VNNAKKHMLLVMYLSVTMTADYEETMIMMILVTTGSLAFVKKRETYFFAFFVC